jgi:hypothetical protein
MVITCVDCGAPRTTRRSNTKYCWPCRLNRNFLFLLDCTHKCWVCAAKFAPIDTHDKLCANCDIHRPRHGEGECGLCGGHGAYLSADLRVCAACFKDPDKRQQMHRELVRRIQVRKDTDWTEHTAQQQRQEEPVL